MILRFCPEMSSHTVTIELRFAIHRARYRVNLRHGVSRLRSGHRHTVGVIFHDAK
jgi:uncharacterized protein